MMNMTKTIATRLIMLLVDIFWDPSIQVNMKSISSDSKK